MKSIIVRIVLVAMLLLASGATAVMADGSTVPVCPIEQPKCTPN